MTLINSALWLSIGYALAVAQGAAVAQRERMMEESGTAGLATARRGSGTVELAPAGSAVVKSAVESVKDGGEDAPQQQQQRGTRRIILFTRDGSF